MLELERLYFETAALKKLFRIYNIYIVSYFLRGHSAIHKKLKNKFLEPFSTSK